MGYRHSSEAIRAARAWRRFVERNTALVDAAGLPPAATESVGAWDDLLVHGYLPADPGHFAVERLSETQYAALAHLAANYFAAGYEFFTPVALRVAEQDALRARFDRGR
jgi:hypothetical protein